MPTISEFRDQYPQYGDMSDDDLIRRAAARGLEITRDRLNLVEQAGTSAYQALRGVGTGAYTHAQEAAARLGWDDTRDWITGELQRREAETQARARRMRPTDLAHFSEDPGGVIAGAIGGAAGSMPFAMHPLGWLGLMSAYTGENIQEQRETQGIGVGEADMALATGVGIAQAAVDRFTGLERLMMRGAPRINAGAIGRTVAGMAIGAGTEGFAEGVQTAMKIAQGDIGDAAQGDLSRIQQRLRDPVNLARIAEDAGMGAIGGAAIRGTYSGLGMGHDQPAPPPAATPASPASPTAPMSLQQALNVVHGASPPAAAPTVTVPPTGPAGPAGPAPAGPAPAGATMAPPGHTPYAPGPTPPGGVPPVTPQNPLGYNPPGPAAPPGPPPGGVPPVTPQNPLGNGPQPPPQGPVQSAPNPTAAPPGAPPGAPPAGPTSGPAPTAGPGPASTAAPAGAGPMRAEDLGNMGKGIGEALREGLWQGYNGQGAMRREPIANAARWIAQRRGVPMARDEFLTFAEQFDGAQTPADRRAVADRFVNRPSERERAATPLDAIVKDMVAEGEVAPSASPADNSATSPGSPSGGSTPTAPSPLPGSTPKAGETFSPEEVEQARAVINSTIEDIYKRGKQGQLAARALQDFITNGLEKRAFNPEQAVAAFGMMEAMSHVLPAGAGQQVEFMQKMTSPRTGGESQGIQVRRPTASADGVQGLIRLSLAEKQLPMARETAAHEAWHVVEDWLRATDRKAWSALQKAFPEKAGKVALADIEPSLLRLLKRNQHDSGGSYYDYLARDNTGFGPGVFMNSGEAQATVFGAIYDMRNSGVKTPMAPLMKRVFDVFSRLLDNIRRSPSRKLMERVASGQFRQQQGGRQADISTAGLRDATATARPSERAAGEAAVQVAPDDRESGRSYDAKQKLALMDEMTARAVRYNKEGTAHVGWQSRKTVGDALQKKAITSLARYVDTAKSSPAFTNWFAGSVVRDDNGNPEPQFHLTFRGGDFTRFMPNSHFGTIAAAHDRGHVLAGNRRYRIDRDEYVDAVLGGYRRPEVENWFGVNDVVIPVFLSIKNPMLVRNDPGNDWEQTIEQAMAGGHDGIEYINEFEHPRSFSYIAFDPGQIRPVIGFGERDSARQVAGLNGDGVMIGFRTEPRIIPVRLPDGSLVTMQPGARDFSPVERTETAPSEPAPVTDTQPPVQVEPDREAARGLPPEAQAALDHLAPSGAAGWLGRAMDDKQYKKGMLAQLSSRLRAAVVDTYTAIEDMEARITGKGRMEADLSGYTALWQAEDTDRFLTGMIQTGGYLELVQPDPSNPGRSYFDINTNKDGGIQWLADLLTGTDPKTGKRATKADGSWKIETEQEAEAVIKAFQLHAIVKRGSNLNAQGILVPITAADRAGAAAAVRAFPEIVPAYKAYQKYNANLMKMASDAGVISEADAKAFMKHNDYYPFYRAVPKNDPIGARKLAGISSKFKHLEILGGDAPLLDNPIQAIMNNSSYWIHAAMRNVAKQKVVASGVNLKVIRPFTKGVDQDASKINVRVDGKNYIFATDDAPLTAALEGYWAMSPEIHRALSIFSVPTRLLRDLVTKNPGFMLATNLIRDSVAAWQSSGSNIVPIASTYIGLMKALGHSDSTMEYVRLGHGGSRRYEDGPLLDAADILRGDILRDKGIYAADTPGKLMGILRKAYTKVDRVSEASDMATRIAMYEKGIAEGLSKPEAAWRAREIMNFTKHGRSTLLRGFAMLVPFTNARIQGADVMYQSLFGGRMGDPGKDASAKRNVAWTRGALLMTVAVMTALAFDDDDEIKEAPEHIRNQNVLVPLRWLGLAPSGLLSIPKPFEYGALFMTLPEQFFRYLAGTQTAGGAVREGLGGLPGSLSFTPIPTFAIPFVEQAANHSFFTGRPIVGPSLQRQGAEWQFTASTPAVYRQWAQAFASTGIPDAMKHYGLALPGFMTSPVAMEHFVRSWTGTLGTYAAVAASTLTESGNYRSFNWEKLPILSSLVRTRNNTPSGTISTLFELAEESSQLAERIKRYSETGDMAMVRQLNRENSVLIAARPLITRTQAQIQRLSQQERALIRDTRIPAETRQRRLREIDMQRREAVKGIEELRLRAGR